MKKILILLILLLLTACNQVTGEATMECIFDAQVITIESYGEEILLWTHQIRYTRLEFDELFMQETFASSTEIIEWFARYSQQTEAGITFEIVEINDNYVILETIYNYEEISTIYKNRIWNDDFEENVTFSSAVAGLIEQGWVCELALREEETDDEFE